MGLCGVSTPIGAHHPRVGTEAARGLKGGGPMVEGGDHGPGWWLSDNKEGYG